MKVVLLQCNWNYMNSIYPNLASKVPYQPLELCYIAEELGENEVKIVDAFLNNMSYERIGDTVSDFKADVVVVDTANTYLFWRCCYLNIDVVKESIKAIRRRSKAKIVIIGPHGTVDPEWALKHTGADYVICGEPDKAVAEFINSNLDEKVKGVASKYNLQNGIAVVEDLGELTVPKYDYIEMKRYRGHGWLNETAFLQHGALMEYSRGCPFYCSFCFRSGFRDKLRVKPYEKVLQEMKFIKETYGIEYFFFIDEIFNVDSDNFRNLLEGMKELNIKYGCQCRPDVMSREVINLMRDSGCVYIEYGLESINKETREKLDKNLDIRKVIGIINYSKKNIENVVYNFLDFTTIDLLLGDKAGEEKNENGAFGFHTDTKALENIVFFPNTELFIEAREKLNVKSTGWDLSIRLYWISVKMKQLDTNAKFQRDMWRRVILHAPMPILKAMMRMKWIYKPQEISYGHEKDERLAKHGSKE